jgi:hypothetical protein
MIERAREFLRTVGFPASFQDSGWGFEQNKSYLNRPIADRAKDGFARQVAHAQTFWYRESPVLFERAFFMGPYLLPTLWDFDPPMTGFSGDVIVSLDREGRLRELDAVPPQQPASKPRATDWAVVFTAAGLNLADWRADAPKWNPRFYGDERVAWIPATAREDDLIRVEAASFHGRPVAFLAVYPWTTPFRDAGSERTGAQRTSDLVGVLFLSGLMLAAVLVARRNFRLDRVDGRGAARLAIVMTSLTFISWILAEHHVPSIWELYLVTLGTGWTLFAGGLVVAFYLALEPYVRRIWPTMIISWSRLMAGAVRDPLVGRDVLIGCAVGAVAHLVFFAGFFANGAVTGIASMFDVSPAPLLGLARVGSALAMTPVWVVFLAFLYLLLLLGLRKLLRREWPAIGAAAVVLGIVGALPAPVLAIALPCEIVMNVAIFVLLARVGLVATIAAFLMSNVLDVYPVTWPLNAWYSNIGLVGIAVTSALAIAAFRIATRGGRK